VGRQPAAVVGRRGGQRVHHHRRPPVARPWEHALWRCCRAQRHLLRVRLLLEPCVVPHLRRALLCGRLLRAGRRRRGALPRRSLRRHRQPHLRSMLRPLCRGAGLGLCTWFHKRRGCALPRRLFLPRERGAAHPVRLAGRLRRRGKRRRAVGVGPLSRRRGLARGAVGGEVPRWPRRRHRKRRLLAGGVDQRTAAVCARARRRLPVPQRVLWQPLAARDNGHAPGLCAACVRVHPRGARGRRGGRPHGPR
jgi:hypothetical protein